MSRATHRGRVRLQSYVEPAFADRVNRYCLAMGVSESAIVKSSLDQYLDGVGDATLLLRRLDRLGRAAAHVGFSVASRRDGHRRGGRPEGRQSGWIPWMTPTP
jgi:hypothetical protein